MTDSPRVQLPIDPEERPIEGQLQQIRAKLELLKQDKTVYVKSEDVIKLYEEVIQQVHALNTIRQAKNKPDEQNRVDIILDDCFSLISLAFMTIGKNNEAPAIYSVVSTIKRLLDHLKEAAFYQAKDLAGINAQLQGFRNTIERCRGNYDAALTTILEARIAVCQKTANELSEILGNLTPELASKWERLVSILRMLSACNTRSTYPKKEVEDLKRQIREIQESFPAIAPTHEQSLVERYAEKLRLAADASKAPPEQLVTDLLERCQLWATVIEKRPGYIDERFQKPYDYLKNIRDNLESRSLLQAWSLRETDLFDYQRKLDRIDEARTAEGNFLDEEGNPACLQTQRTLLYLLRKNYALIYQLLTSSEPVSEALLPIYNQLKTLKRCLQEVQKAGGVSSPRELYPYSMKLNSIDNMKKDGKFMVGDDIPDGQGAVIALMEECFELSYQLREQAEEVREEAEPDIPGPASAVAV